MLAYCIAIIFDFTSICTHYSFRKLFIGLAIAALID